MYDPGVVKRRLKLVSQKLGFELTYHTLAEIEQANKRLTDIFDADKGRPIRSLYPHERQWIKNETAICMCDFKYWSERYAFILDKVNRLIRFKPNLAQTIIEDIWAELEAAGRGIEIQEAKARQLGVSTLTELAVAHRVQFYPNVNALVASSDPRKSEKMAKMMERAWWNQPWFLVPETTAYRVGEIVEFGHQNSGVSIQHGAQVTGIARGDTPTVCHLSELADFIDPHSIVDASLFPAMHTSSWLFLILESTAAGIHNWWHDSWDYNKQNWKSGRARLRPIFLPWFVGTDVWPDDAWLHDRPVPSDFKPSSLTLKHAARAEANVKVDETLRTYLGPEWKMSPEQMWFYEVTRDEYKAKGELAQFYAEFPADDTEMFQSTNLSAFDVDIITEYNEGTRPPKVVYGFLGRVIPPRLQPDRREIDTSQPPVHIRRHTPQGGTFECSLVPLRFQGYAQTDFTNRLFIYELPEEGADYALGIDTGDGIGQDRTVMEMVRKGDDRYNEKQVAEYASAYINAFDIPALAFPLLCYYSVDPDRSPPAAKCIVECNRNGEGTQLELRKLGWYYHHNWIRYDNKRLRPSRATKLGWWSNSWSRPMILDFLIRHLRDEWLDIYSPYFVQEMRDLERNEDQQSLKAMHGGHDDRIMAMGMALWSMIGLLLENTQRGMLFERQQRRGEPVPESFPLYNPSGAYSRPILLGDYDGTP